MLKDQFLFLKHHEKRWRLDSKMEVWRADLQLTRDVLLVMYVRYNEIQNNNQSYVTS